ncbi:hypothetical protein ACRQ5D_09605 [Mucilaginibacter sp. P25]|uniref:Uncharacterized protein n=1 Tax=Mucilaginibacter gossypii TaxID=551996 RepID=A0A1G8I4Y7_9SPHI|nr:hypothetical protein [Mucilaginibacter gossypii]SDI13892.1 hypothetical protein SAMN05192573_116125 [Mucilaginibacter gossypii]
MENNENPIPVKQPKNSLALILIVAGCILIIGNLYFYIARQKRYTIKRQQLDSLAKQLDTANAKFEIGYGEMSIASYNKMKIAAGQKDHSPLVYPVMKNEIDDLITAGSYHPDYGISSTYLEQFTTLYRQKKLKPMGTAVACLIIKQVGKGKAESVKLDINRLKLDEVSEMFDPTDINKFTDPERAAKSFHSNSLQIDLGPMDTGEALLMPLYISNGFLRLTEGGDPPGWSVTAGPILLPVSLNYIKKDKRIQKIPLQEVLNRPIEILD